MSQVNGLAGDGASQKNTATTGRAVLLLAVFVVLSILLLHEMDKPSSDNNLVAKSETVAPQQSSTQQAVTPTTASTVPARTPAEVKVLVANGIGVSGAASKVAGRLQPVGYQLVKPGNTINKETVSLVEYGPGYQAEAQALATSLGLQASAVQALPTPAPVQDLQGSNIVVIVGNDLANATTSTSTTSPGALTQSQTGSGGNTGSSSQGAGNTAANPLTNGPLTNLNTTTSQLSR